jgi:hypothetical protein
MKRAMSWALLVAGTALAISAAPAIPAAAATIGTETLGGTIVFAAVPVRTAGLSSAAWCTPGGCSRASAGSSR